MQRVKEQVKDIECNVDVIESNVLEALMDSCIAQDKKEEYKETKDEMESVNKLEVKMIGNL